MNKVQKGDFIELEYTASIKENNLVFDTTNEEIAKRHNIYHKEHKYNPVVVCIGEEIVVKGLDKDLEGKEIGKEYLVELVPEEAYGKKDPKLYQLVSAAKFKSQDMMPMPGLQVTVDNLMGVIKTVSGGRVMIDFNHPLAGKNINYAYKIVKVIENDEEKLKAFSTMYLPEAETSLKENTALIKLKQSIPNEIQEMIKEKLQKSIPSIKNVEFEVKDNKTIEKVATT